MPDVTEDDAMSALHELISIWSKDPKGGVVPSTEELLSQCVNIDMTPAQLRIAIHQHLAFTPSDLVAVLKILQQWLQTVALDSGNQAPENHNGKRKGDLTPPLSKVCFLDLIELLKGPSSLTQVLRGLSSDPRLPPDFPRRIAHCASTTCPFSCTSSIYPGFAQATAGAH
jgi:hypothetical protein